jgi:hypothetical protein
MMYRRKTQAERLRECWTEAVAWTVVIVLFVIGSFVFYVVFDSERRNMYLNLFLAMLFVVLIFVSATNARRSIRGLLKEINRQKTRKEKK